MVFIMHLGTVAKLSLILISIGELMRQKGIKAEKVIISKETLKMRLFIFNRRHIRQDFKNNNISIISMHLIIL